MDAAGDLARREQAGDGLAADVDDPGGGVDLHAAHGVVDARGDLDGVVGRLAQVGLHAGGAVEVRVLLIRHVLIPLCQGVGQGGGVDLQLLRQGLDGVALDGDAGGDVFFDGLEAVAQVLVEDDVGVAAGLGQLAGGDHVAGQQLVDEALALLVDQDRAVAADALGDEHAGALLHGGVELDLVDVHQSRAHRLGHADAVAGDAGGAGGDGALEVGLVVDDHVLIVAEAAGGQDDRLGTDGIVGAVALGLDAHDGAVQGHKAGGFGVVHHLDAQIVYGPQESGDQIRADAGAVLRGVDAPVGGAAGEGDLGQGRADGIQPVDALGGVLRHDRDQILVVDVVAALHGVLHELGHGVLDALLLLIVGLGGVHAAGGLGGVAAGIGHLFQNDDLLARLSGVDGGGHARAAGADDDDVGLQLLIGLLAAAGLADLGESGQIRAGQHQGVVQGAEHRVAGDGSAGESVHIGALGRQDAVVEHVHGEGADVLGLVAAVDLNVVDGLLGHGDGDVHVAAEALGAAGVGAGDEQIVPLGLRRCHDLLAGGEGEGLGRGVLDRLGREGGPGDGVDVGALGLQDAACQGGDGSAAHVRGLAVALDLYICDAAGVAHGQGDVHGAAEAVGGAGVVAGLECSLRVGADAGTGGLRGSRDLAALGRRLFDFRHGGFSFDRLHSQQQGDGQNAREQPCDESFPCDLLLHGVSSQFYCMI